MCYQRVIYNLWLKCICGNLSRTLQSFLYIKKQLVVLFGQCPILPYVNDGAKSSIEGPFLFVLNVYLKSFIEIQSYPQMTILCFQSWKTQTTLQGRFPTIYETKVDMYSSGIWAVILILLHKLKYSYLVTKIIILIILQLVPMVLQLIKSDQANSM